MRGRVDRHPHGPANHVATSFVPGNNVAKGLYLSVGFVETGELDGDELVAKYELRPSS